MKSPQRRPIESHEEGTLRSSQKRAMRQERRIFLEAVIVSVIGHAIFFSVFAVKEGEVFRSGPRLPTAITIAQFQGLDLLGSRATTNPAVTDPDLLAHVELERRTAAPRLELDRTALVWEDEPQFAAPAPPQVGPATWGFAKESGGLPDQFPADYDAGPSLAMTREALAGGTGDRVHLRFPFTIAFRKTPGAGALMLGPGEDVGEDVRFFSGEIRFDRTTGKLDYVVRPSGDPQVDAAVMSRMQRWQFTLERTDQGYTLRGRLPFPVSTRGGPQRRPPSADELLDDKAQEESP
jgi:hypothetical protein